MSDPKDSPQWKRMRFKRNKVWLAVDHLEQPLMENGKVLIKYQLDQSHEYWVHPASVRSLDEPPADHDPGGGEQSAPHRQTAVPQQAAPADAPKAIRIYTDGACSGNPGPAGIGVVMRYADRHKEISRAIGRATNNVAELEAVRQGLAAVKNRQLPVAVFTDSSYVMGVLTQGWKSRHNLALIGQIRDLIGQFRQVRFIKVKGHAGHPENERADHLAVKAIRQNKTP